MNAQKRVALPALIAAAGLFCWLASRGLQWGIVTSPSGRVFILHLDEASALRAVAKLIETHRTYMPADVGVWPYYRKGLFFYTEVKALAWASGLAPGSRTFQLLGRGWIVLQGLLCVLLTGWLGGRAYSAGVGAAAALLLAVSPGLVAHSHYLTADVPLTMLAAAVLACCLEIETKPSGKAALALGACLGLAVATKHSGAVLSLPAAWSARRLSPKLRAALAGTFLLVLAAADPILWAEPATVLKGARMLDENNRHGLAYSSARWPGWLDYAVSVLPYSLGTLLTAFSLAGLAWLAVGKPPNRPFSKLLLIYFAASWFLLGFDRWRLVRYTLPLLPVLCLAAAALSSRLWKAGRAGRLSAGALFSAAFVGALFHSAAYTGAMRMPDPRLRAFLWFYDNVHGNYTMGVPYDDFSRVPTPPGAAIVETAFDWDKLESPRADYFVHSDIDWLEYKEAAPYWPKEAAFIAKIENGPEFEQAATFENPMRWLGFTLHKGWPPHDWLYPDAAITVYKRRAD